MNNDNLKSVHGTLIQEGYNPPEYEQFAKDMEDDNNLQGVYNTLKKEGYTPPEYDVFKKDMGFGVAEPDTSTIVTPEAQTDVTPQQSIPTVQTDQQDNTTVDPNLAIMAQEGAEQFAKHIINKEEEQKKPGTPEWRNRTVDIPGQNPYNGQTYGAVYDSIIQNFGKNLNHPDIDPYADARAQIRPAGITDDLKPEEADNLALQIREGYANKYAQGEAKDIVSTLPDQVPDIDNLMDGLWYNRGLQEKIAHEARRLGLRQENYINYYMKPQLAKALSERYGYDVDSAKHIASRLMSQDQHVMERVRQNEAANMIGQYAEPEIQNYFDQAIKNADDQFLRETEKVGQYTPSGLPNGQILVSAARAYQNTDPAKIWEKIKPNIEKMATSITENPEFFAEAMNHADEEGIETTKWIEGRILPMLESQLQAKFEQMAIEREMPKNTMDYLWQNIQQSLVGTIARTALESQARRRMKAEALQRTEMGRNQNYTPSFGARIGGGAAAMLPDMVLPFGGPFGVTARIASAPVRGTAQELIAEGMRPLLARITESSLSGMANLGAFEGVKGAVEGGMVPIDQDSFLEDNRSAGEVMKDIINGFAERGISSSIAGATMIGHPIANKFVNGRGALANALGWIGGSAIDAAGATTLNTVPGIISGDITLEDVGKDFASNLGTFMALGLHGKAKEFASLAKGGKAWNGVEFTKSDIETLEDRFLMPLRKQVEEIEKAQNKKGLISKRINGDYTNDAINLVGTTMYNDLMRSYAVPRDLKVKVAQALGMDVPEYAMKPQVIDLFNQVRNKTVGVGMEDAMNFDYNKQGGVADKLMNGEALNNYELTLRLLFQDNKAFNEALIKQRNGEPLTEQEQELIAVNTSRLQQLQRDYSNQETNRIISIFERNNNMEPGSLKQMLADVAEGKAVDSNLLNEFEQMLKNYNDGLDLLREAQQAQQQEQVSEEAPAEEAPMVNKVPEETATEEAPAEEVANTENVEQKADSEAAVKDNLTTDNTDPFINRKSGTIMEVQLIDGRKAYIVDQDEANGLISLVDEQGKPITMTDKSGYVIDKFPASFLQSDNKGMPIIKETAPEKAPEAPKTEALKAETPAVETQTENVPAMSKIKTDESGEPVWEESAPEDTAAALRETLGSNEEAVAMIDEEIADLTSQVAELTKPDKKKKHLTMNERLKKKEQIRNAQAKLDYWQGVKDIINNEREDKTVQAVDIQNTSGEAAGNGEAGQGEIQTQGSEEKIGTDTQQPQAKGPEADTGGAPVPDTNVSGGTSAIEQPAEPTAEQKVAQATVKKNIGKRYEFKNQDGTRSKFVIDNFKGDDMVTVTRQDYDANGNPKGEPYSQDLKYVEVGNSIVNGFLKPSLSTEEKLREAYKGKVGMQNLIDTLTDKERQDLLNEIQNGDGETLSSMISDLADIHKEDMILNERDKRVSNVARIMDGTGSREDKLRRVRKEYQGYDDAVLALSDESMQPTTLEEYIADLHSRQPKAGEGPLAYFSYDKDGKKVVGMQDETGHGTKSGGDTKGYAPWLAPKGKGMSLQEYAENIHSQLPDAIKDQYSDQDVRNAILDVFGGAERPSDITTMVIKRGIVQAEEAARRMEEMWIEGGPGYQKVSPDDNSFAGRLSRAKQITNSEPTEGQKKAGNYKKGHLSFGGYDFVVENPEGSMRRGTDADGKKWEQKMNNTYGYILGKKGKDGDHLDMFINDAQDLDNWNGNVYVVDQVDPKTGKFDESKVLYGFNSEAEARDAYLSNYEEGWQGLGKITGTDKATFDKWLDSSDRQIKPFAEHSIIKDSQEPQQKQAPTDAEIDTALRNKLIEIPRANGVDISTDYEADQALLDRVNGTGDVKQQTTDESKVGFHKVEDVNELKQLESHPTVKRYRAMQLIDGKLYPPMSAKVNGKMRQPTEIGVWEKSEERPDLIKNGKFVLNKGQKGQGNVPAAYNPYFHTSTSGLNDQFTSAYKRPELVVVEVEIPESELTSGYKAEGAKDAVGNVDWHSGVVNGQLPADRQRQVTLSRYNKVNRIVPDSEVADMIAKQLEGTNVEVPYNVVTPALRAELEKRGVKISDKPAGSVTEDINGKPIRYQKAETPIFVSNALKAVEAIKQEKATPDQWLAMLQKNGGLKAGEDKWIGLSDYLEEAKKEGKNPTKQEVLDYIRQNQIQVEEQKYREYIDLDNNPKMQEYRREFNEILEDLKKDQGNLQKEMEDFENEMYDKYGYGWANKLNEEEQEIYDAQVEKYGEYQDDINDAAFNEMVNRHGDDFSMAFEYDYGSGELVPTMDMYGDDISDAAKTLLEFDELPINSTRLDYTTDGLTNKKEIALTVPTIAEYGENDPIHFGDADNGRAVAWIRFGDTNVPIKEDVVKHVEEFEEPWDNGRGSTLYYPKGSKPGWGKDYIIHAKKKDGNYIYGVVINGDGIGSYNSFEDAKDRMNRFYQAHPKTKVTGNQKILVIDEIQSKRHQDGREKGYKSSNTKKVSEAYSKANSDLFEYEEELSKKYNGGTWWEKLTPEETAKRKELKDNRDAAMRAYDEVLDKSGRGPVPEAPFEKNWHELAMKRMLRYAAENGYDKIAWTTGEQQAERYNIGGIVPNIEVTTNPGDEYFYKDLRFSANGNGCRICADENGKIKIAEGLGEGVEGKSLGEVFGKDVAAQIMNTDRPHSRIQLEGKRIGADGMKGFYDQILPRFMDKYGKKWGVKTGEIELPGLEDSAQKMHSIDVTPEMKESVMQGQPMFFKTPEGYAYGFTYKGKIHIDPRIATSETPIHEYGHLWAEMKRQSAPEEWNHIKDVLLRDKLVEPFIEKVKRDYPELAGDGKEDSFIEEVLTQFSGKHGAEKLRKMAEEIKQDLGGDATAETIAEATIRKVKSVLNEFWKSVCDMMGWKYTNAEDIADAVLRDMLNGVNPVEKMREASKDVKSQQEVERTLMGVHNLTEDKLRKVLKQGGLANPSLAVIDTKNHMHNDYGDISLIPKASLIDSKTGRNAGTFTADAWTPTYPTVYRRMTDKGQSKFWKDIRKLNDEAGEVANHMRMAFDTWLDKEVGQERLAYWYMSERGMKPELVLNKNPYGEDIVKRIDELTDNGNLEVSRLPEEQIKEIADMYHAYKESKGEPVTPAEERIAKLQERIDPNKQTPFSKLQQYRLEELQKYGELLHNLNDFEYAVRRSAAMDGKPNIETTVDKAAKAVKEQNLEQDFDKWLQDKADSYGIEEWLYNGTDDRTGRQKYVRNTLENASKLMRKEGLNGATNWSSAGNWIAKVANKEKTLGGIRKNRKNLDTTREEHDAFREKWGDLLYDIATKMGQGDHWSGENRMGDALDHSNPADYVKREYGVDLSKEDRATIDEFIKQVRTNFPTGYFETKFERPVMLDEFEIAVVPENTSPDVVEALKNAGLDVRTYDNSGKMEERDEARRNATMDAVQGRDDIMFQMMGKKGAEEADKAEGSDERSRNLAIAEDSEKAGVDAKAIKLATGWERGADGQWRYEIPDADVDILAKFNDKFAEMKADGVESPEPILKLSELLGEDNDLFKYYPKMKNMQVLFSKGLPDGTSGAYDNGTVELNIKEVNRFDGDDLNNENLYGTLLHEIQHAIQDIEGFAQGGNLYTSTTDEGIKAIIEKKNREAWWLKQKLDANRSILNNPDDLEAAAELEQKSVKEVKDRLLETINSQAAEYDTINLQIARLKHTKSPSKSDAMDLYHRLAGEVEARNVESRMALNDIGKRQTLASVTEDVPRDEQVIINGNSGPSASMGDIREKEVKNTVIDSTKDENIPTNREDAINSIPKGGKEVHNTDQDIDIIVSRSTLKHSALHDEDYVYKAFGKIDDIVKDAVKIGNIPVAKDEANKTNSVSIYYAPVSVDGVQYSARLLVKELINLKGAILEDLSLYNVSMHKEKATSNTGLNSPETSLGSYSEGAKSVSDASDGASVSSESPLLAYKVKDLIHSTQENDQKLLGITDKNGLRFQRVSNPEPELTSEDRQYWNKWDADMKKWKERNAIPADAQEPGEETPKQSDEDMMDYVLRIARHRIEKAKWQTAPKLDDYLRMRTDKDTLEAAKEYAKKYPDSQQAKMRLAAAEFQQIRSAIGRQKAYDKATVKAVTDFAQEYMKMGFGDHLSRGEIERLLSSVKNATGARDIRNQIDNIMNILTDNYLRNLDQRVQKLSSVKELKQTAQGVEAQGKLELKGQRMIQAFREAREARMTPEDIRNRMAEVSEKMVRNDEEAPMWEQEYEGLSIALQYAENIEGSRQEWGELNNDYKDAVKGYKESGRTYAEQQQYLDELDKAMMENKLERIGLFGEIIGRLEGNIAESVQGAHEFVEREKQRVKHIQDIANYDLAGKDMGAMREKGKGKHANFFLQPLGTFEQMLKQFGSKNANGEGYLYDYFMRTWADATDKAFTNEQKAKEQLDEKAREVFGDEVKRWSDLYKLTRNEKEFPGMDVDIVDQNERKTFHLNQGNLLYIYMANKMSDGAMKLRKMGITEEDVEAIKDHLDPRLVELGDWLQDDYLVNKRTEYNKVHERMFGAPMAAIDHYFPIRILGDARVQEQDVANMADQDAVLPSTITGNIIKRRRNSLPLDILHTDALSLAIEHIEDMERWAATAEWNKDINTLLSYTTFRNKVKNMKTIYGSGDALWNTFADTARMAAGTYSPKAKPGTVDSAISNVAKGVTAAKINFRVYTALKQLLSAPAFLHDVDLGKFVKNSVNPYGSWKWAMENMPMFKKRWKSRQVGDTRLMDDPTDWKMWKNDIVQMATRMGMSPNALVDGVTCAVGARSIYESRLKKYKNMGMDDDAAKKRALQDAEIGYNLTQQSSEGAFVSAIQKDRTVAANALSVFRNSSMAYTRQWVDAARNLKHKIQPGYRDESIKFMAKQFEDQLGLDEQQAQEAAEKEYARSTRHDIARMLNMMFGVTVAWNLGASLPYLLIGDDNETKKEMLTDALYRGLLAGPTEGLATGNIISELVGKSIANEETRNIFEKEGLGAAIDAGVKQAGDYEVNPLPLMADIHNIIEHLGYDKYAAIQDIFNIAAQSLVGVNPQTMTDIWNAAMDYGNPSWMPGTDKTVGNDQGMLNAKEIALFIMRVINAPTSSWRNKYIDELGMNAEEAKNLSYDEMARRYANYKHWKDAPVTGWFRSDEERQKKMESIRKQFDKAVAERMGRLTDEGLTKTFENTNDESERKMLGKEAANRADSEDKMTQTSGKSEIKKNATRLYTRHRTWQDLSDDLELEKAKRDFAAIKKQLDELKADADRFRTEDVDGSKDKLAKDFEEENKDVLALLKEIEKAQKDIRAMRDKLTGIDGVDDQWQNIREKRNEILEKVRKAQQSKEPQE